MVCCESNIITFVDDTVTTVAYNGEFGDEPQIDVLYLIDGVWKGPGVFTNISRTPTVITVDHGGVATGFIKGS